MKQHMPVAGHGLGLVGPLVEQLQAGQVVVLADGVDDLGAGPDVMFGVLRICSTRYCDMPASSDGPRINIVTDLAVCDMYMAAWPAELAPPTM